MPVTHTGPRRRTTPQVQVVSGSFGAGHDAAARSIASTLAEAGCTSAVRDVVDAYPVGLGRLVRRAYLAQLRHAPSTWGALLARLDEPGALSRISRRAITLAAHGLERLSDHEPELIISTHPFASQALGHLRSIGRLRSPVVTYLTDMSVHPLWIHPGVDLHLALHPVPASQAQALGAHTAVIESALTQPGPRRRRPGPEELLRTRSRLGLPVDRPLALVTGGAYGIGDLERSAEDISATGEAHPVVLCGHNHHLRRTLGRRRDLTALGWRDDVPEILGAVDVVVQNAGGFTSQQALAAGVPQISYRCVPGHGESNAAALAEARLVPWARSPDELGRLVEEALLVNVIGAVPTRPFDLVDLGDLASLVGLALGVRAKVSA
jgi:UDP-N-acetylglucosamine:LPS N-acetylglucosamine transferase